MSAPLIFYRMVGVVMAQNRALGCKMQPLTACISSAMPYVRSGIALHSQSYAQLPAPEVTLLDKESAWP